MKFVCKLCEMDEGSSCCYLTSETYGCLPKYCPFSGAHRRGIKWEPVEAKKQTLIEQREKNG